MMTNHLETWHGEQSGRDPRELDMDELQALGHEKRPILKVLRAKCIDCCVGQQSEVRRCACARSCALWPYRMGKNPFTGRKGNLAALMGGGSEDEEPEE